MSKFNSKLKQQLDGKKATASLINRPKLIQKPNTTNISGSAAHDMQPFLKLLSMLNTLKLESQYYKSENQQVKDLKTIIDQCAKIDLYFTCQCVVYSRCMADGMRSVAHVASVFLAPHLSGKDYAKRFYSSWDKRNKRGGVIYRTDDMNEIMSFYKLNNNKSLPASMKKGFASVIEGLDMYNFGKYTKQIRDVANMVHPNPKNAPKIVVPVSKTFKNQDSALNYIMQGNNIPAHTWERAQAEAGQEVAKALKEGKVSQVEAEQILKEAKEANWNQLLQEGRLGILAALRNIRNIILSNPTPDTVGMLRNLFSDPRKIRDGKIMPYQIDMAIEVINNEFGNTVNGRTFVEMLMIAYGISIPNLAEIFTGSNLVIVDQSGSMWSDKGKLRYAQNSVYNSFAGDKANLIAATIAKSTKADIIRFGGKAEYVNYNFVENVFQCARNIEQRMGTTNLSVALELAAKSGRKYDRIIILSDYEVNRGNTYATYQKYVNTLGNPYIYSVDMAAYGTTQLVGPKVHYLYGYGTNLYDQMKIVEFNAAEIIDTIKSIVI